MPSLFCAPDERGYGDELRDRPLIAVDVETTGLDAAADRVLELAIVRLDRHGRVEDEWVSLLDPGCDVGPTFIHHITNEMIAGAPAFRDVLGDVVVRLEGGIIVSHYAEFEDGFIRSELGRLGVEIAPQPGLCTLELSRDMLDAPNFRLATCCDHVGLDQPDTGGALGDARCKAHLARHLLSNPMVRMAWSTYPTLLPRYPRRATPRTRVTELRKGRTGWMADVIAKLPVTTGVAEEPIADAYLDAVARALEDGKLTGDEAKVLARMAGRAGLGAAELAALNSRFLDGLAASALDDHVLTSAELAQMRRSAQLLGSPGYFDHLADQVARPSPRTSRTAVPPRVWCSPGIPQLHRAALERAGLSIAANLTPKVRAVIVSEFDVDDPRVRRARDLGIAVVSPFDIPELASTPARSPNHLAPPRQRRHDPPWLDGANL